MAEMSKYDTRSKDFYQIINVRHQDAFTLRPLFIKHGPLKGKHVLVLERPQPFRFLDLPPELRMMIYSFLFEEPEPITIIRFKTRGLPRRLVMSSFMEVEKHRGLEWDAKSGTWINQPPSKLALLAVSKQVLQVRKQLTTAFLKYSHTDNRDQNSLGSRPGHVWEQYLLIRACVIYERVSIHNGQYAPSSAGSSNQERWIYLKPHAWRPQSSQKRKGFALLELRYPRHQPARASGLGTCAENLAQGLPANAQSLAKVPSNRQDTCRCSNDCQHTLQRRPVRWLPASPPLWQVLVVQIHL